MSQENLYHIDTPPAPPSAPQVNLFTQRTLKIEFFSRPLLTQFLKASYQQILAALQERPDIQIENCQFRDLRTLYVPFAMSRVDGSIYPICMASFDLLEVRISLSVDEDPDIMIQQRTISKVRDSDWLEIS